MYTSINLNPTFHTTIYQPASTKHNNFCEPNRIKTGLISILFSQTRPLAKEIPGFITTTSNSMEPSVHRELAMKGSLIRARMAQTYDPPAIMAQRRRSLINERVSRGLKGGRADWIESRPFAVTELVGSKAVSMCSHGRGKPDSRLRHHLPNNRAPRVSFALSPGTDDRHRAIRPRHGNSTDATASLEPQSVNQLKTLGVFARSQRNYAVGILCGFRR